MTWMRSFSGFTKNCFPGMTAADAGTAASTIAEPSLHKMWKEMPNTCICPLMRLSRSISIPRLTRKPAAIIRSTSPVISWMIRGNCILGDCVPQNCLDYPYTDKPDRMESLLSFLEAVAVCPVAYEICERLKGHYGFQ